MSVILRSAERPRRPAIAGRERSDCAVAAAADNSIRGSGIPKPRDLLTVTGDCPFLLTSFRVPNLDDFVATRCRDAGHVRLPTGGQHMM